MIETGTLSELVAELVAAWNDADASRFGLLFTERADYVTGRGAWIHGRNAIEVLCRSAERTAIMVDGAVSVRLHGDAATVLFRWTSRAHGDAARRGVISCVAVREDDRWRIDRLQNTDTVAPSRS